MQTILTKYLGPTNTKGSRIKAMTSGPKPVSIIHDWQYALGNEENYRQAAHTLAKKLGWRGKWIGHGAPAPYESVFVNVSEYAPAFTITQAEHDAVFA